jgi:amino acid adenylation domain-containing protein
MQSEKVTHYGHFIKYLSDIDSSASDSFWVSRLSEMAAPIFPLLPRSGYQAKASSSAARDVVATLPPHCSVTMASMIQSAWAALLSTFTSSEQVVFGLTVNGRDADVVGIEDMLGPTIATVPVLLDINRNWTIGEFLSQVQRLSAERMPYQHAGLQHIRQLNDDTAIACDFQNMLMITSESGSETDSGMWNLRSTGAVGTNFFTYPLMVSCTVSGELIKIAAQYDPHVIGRWLVERILVQFEHTLHQLTSSAMQKAKVGDMLVLNATDQQQINAWNNKPLHTVRNTIHESIFSHKLGSSPALQSWDGSFTFSQIDSLTSKVARRLVYSGVKCGDFVPLCFEKGALYVVAMLGTLKSGAAFVPLDPEAPESRLRDLVRGANANLMLCSPRQKSICEPLGVSVLAIDLNMTEHSLISSTTLPSVSPEQAAYCIYTSGSTGKPKGTVVQHYAFVSNAIPCADMLYIEPGSRVLQFSSYVFDSSLIEILTPLMQSCCVFVPAGEDRLTNLMAYMQKNKIDWACLTPTVAQTMHPSLIPHLKTLVLAGEAMSLHHVSTWAPHVRLVNGYGPTETSVAATINSQMTGTSSPSNIGCAVGGRCWIVDKNNHDRLQPLGAVGEILVEGPTLASGYLNNPQKTAEVFITSPAWAQEAQFQTDPYPRRFYKTGDLAKHNEDGSFSFIGRKDAQVKVRGQRLELGEVEQNLSLDPLVKHVIAAIPASGPGTKRLIAALCINGSSGKRFPILSNRFARSNLKLFIVNTSSPRFFGEYRGFSACYWGFSGPQRPSSASQTQTQNDRFCPPSLFPNIHLEPSCAE